jgi:hypothetical protein
LSSAAAVVLAEGMPQAYLLAVVLAVSVLRLT